MIYSDKRLIEKPAMDFPIFKPIDRQTTNPGPAVAATPSIISI